MATPITVEQLLQGNKEYAKGHKVPPMLKELQAKAGPNAVPSATCIISCSDPRVVPESFFGFGPGQVSVVRNAGGRAFEALRTVLLIHNLVRGGFKTIMIVHHTDCGVTHITDQELQAKIAEATPDRKEQTEGMSFGTFTDPEQSVRDDIKVVKAWPGLKSDVNVLGYVYDLADGLVKEVRP